MASLRWEGARPAAPPVLDKPKAVEVEVEDMPELPKSRV